MFAPSKAGLPVVPFPTFPTLPKQFCTFCAGAIDHASLTVLPGYNQVVARTRDFDIDITSSLQDPSIIQTLAVALSTTFIGGLFRAFGYSANHPLGIALLGPMAGLFLFGGFLSFRRYRLN